MLQKLRLGGILVLALAVLFTATLLPAQTSRGTISGVITDPSGAVVQNAKVSAIQKDTNLTRETTTNTAGIYRFDAVNLGTYQMKVTAPGFASTSANGIEVRANQITAMDFALRVGKATETMEVAVSGLTVELQTDEQLRGRNIDSRSIVDLPVGGQNSLNLMTLIPGILPTNMSGGGSLDSGIGSVNGSRPRANNFMLDGVDNNDISVAGPAIVISNPDTISEVSVQTANFSAEFGRSGGAVINQITKSGTNKLHGTAAWLYRSSALNASSFDERYSYFQGGGKDAGDPLKSAFLEHTPAFTIGGPAYIPGAYDGRNKTFFFVAGQWDRYNSGSFQKIVTIPTASGVALLQTLAPFCPNAKLYLSAIGNLVAGSTKGSTDISVPAEVTAITGNACGPATNPTRAGMSLDYGSATRVQPVLFYGNTMQARVDHILSNKHQVSFRFLSSPGSYAGAYSLGMAPTFDAGYAATSYTGAITDTYNVSSHVTNELRLNYARVAVDWPVLGGAGSLGATLPTISITAFTGLGTSSSWPQGRTFNNYELQDTMTWVHGKHTIRFGLDVNKQIARQIAPMPVRGALGYQASTVTISSVDYKVNAFANFLDDFSGAGNNVVSKQFGSAMYHPNSLRQSYFIQDSLKLTPQFTLNMGLRYDYFGQPANDNFPFPAVSMNPAQFPNKDRIPADRNNFGPSVGFAYNPRSGIFSDGKTVIRGGYQIGYDGFYNNLLSNMATGAPNNPTNLPQNATIVPATPRGVSAIYSAKFPALVASPFTDPLVDTASQYTPNIRNPYTQRWSLGVQRETFWNMLLDVSWVASISRKLFITEELNPRLPDGTGVAGVRLDPRQGSRTVRNSGANSYYNGLQVDLRRKPVQTAIGGIAFDTAYTWSKNLDVVSETFATSSQGSAYASSRWMGLKSMNLDYGPSDMDRRHRLVTSFLWDLRGPKQGFLGEIFGGWSITAAVPLMSGTPFTVLNGFDRDGDGSSAADRPDIGNVHAPITSRAIVSTPAQGCTWGLWNPDLGACTYPARVHWVQSKKAPGIYTARRNSAYSDGTISADVSILKKFRIGEKKNLEYRAEIFDVTNTTNFNYAPNGVSAYGMRLDQAPKNFLPWNESDYYTNPGSRTIRMQLKFSF